MSYGLRPYFAEKWPTPMFHNWCKLKIRAESYRNNGKTVPTNIRKRILILEGASLEEANYLIQFPEEEFKKNN